MEQMKALPLLLRRKHLIKEFGLSDALYYSLLKKGELPTVTLNGRKYVHRDKLLERINATPYSTDGKINYEEDKICPV